MARKEPAKSLRAAGCRARSSEGPAQAGSQVPDLLGPGHGYAALGQGRTPGVARALRWTGMARLRLVGGVRVILRPVLGGDALGT